RAAAASALPAAWQRPAPSRVGSGRSQRVGRKRVASIGLTTAEAALEPALALRRRAVREALRTHDAAGLTLQGVVTDLAGGVERLLMSPSSSRSRRSVPC